MQVEERKKPADKGVGARGNSNAKPGDAALKQNRGTGGFRRVDWLDSALFQGLNS